MKDVVENVLKGVVMNLLNAVIHVELSVVDQELNVNVNNTGKSWALTPPGVGLGVSSTSEQWHLLDMLPSPT